MEIFSVHALKVLCMVWEGVGAFELQMRWGLQICFFGGVGVLGMLDGVSLVESSCGLIFLLLDVYSS